VETLHLSAREWAERAPALQEEGWRLLSYCGLDRLGLGLDPRFAVVAQLLHRDRKERQMVIVAVPCDPPTVRSVVDVWPTADFMEREAYDMFGIVFEGHPDLTRILMPDEWEGYPLRRDYGVGKVPVEFVPQPYLQIESPGQSPDFQEAGLPVDNLGQGGPPQRRRDAFDVEAGRGGESR